MKAYIGLGANLGDPQRTLRSALRGLDDVPGTRCLRSSRFYLNPPLGPQNQNYYTNAVAELETGLDPMQLLAWLQDLERRHGRVRGRRWGPRTLDLDLLLAGGLKRRTVRLTLPHPRLHQRAFVLYPLAELAPQLAIPGRGALSYWLTRASSQNLRPIAGW